MNGGVRIVALGGLGEVGMNCLAVEQRGEVLVIDCGVTFDRRGLGVDVIHPDFACLEQFRDRIRGVFLTHGHEDHIGALPYFLKQFDVPVWGPPYALGLVRERLRDHEILAHARLFEAMPRSRYAVGSFTVEPVRVTHSIADATALAISTDAGLVVHTGDFKFDEAPVDGEAFDVERLSALGAEGVALLLSDSTNVDADGIAGSEGIVAEALEQLVVSAMGRVVVALFASNVHRLQALGAIARKTGRKIVVLGRSVGTHSRVLRALGRLDWADDLVFSAERAMELPRASVLGIATGTQAEPNAALSRLARGEHPLILEHGDTVILSSRAIPGHEPEVYAMMGEFLHRGIAVHSRASDRRIHVSGHAHRGEQRRMLELLRPRAFVPVHGTLHHLTRHAELARQFGIQSVSVLENGDVASLNSGGGVQRVDRWPVGRVHTFGGKAIAPHILRERAKLATSGVVAVAISVDANGRVGGAVRVTTLGVADDESARRLCAEAEGEVRSAVDAVRHGDTVSEALVVEAARLAARRPFARELGFKPQTVVSVIPPGGPRKEGAA
jgi:ribonuclease J